MNTSVRKPALLALCSAALLVSFAACGKKPAASAEKTYTYRIVTAAPHSWSPTDVQTNEDAEVINRTSAGLYEFALNDARDNFIVTCEMAADFPQDVTAEFAGNPLYGVPADATEGWAWRIPLNKDAKWENGTPINADTYLYSAQQYLNPEMKNYRAGTFYVDSLPLANGEAYYEGTGSWSDVGIIKNDDYTITLVLTMPLSPFTFFYNSSNFLLLYKDLYEANKKAAGDLIKSSYGTSPESYMSYGPYRIASYQPDKIMLMERNPQWYGWTDGKHEGQYQTTHIEYNYIKEHATELNLFLQGKLDAVSLTAADLQKYGNSEYRLITPTSYTYKFSFNIDRDALKKLDGDGVNHSVISYIDFRHGFSLAIDRQKYVDTISPASTPGYGLMTTLYVANPDSGESYRDTPQAKQALCEFYGVQDEDDITGYNPEQARVYLQKAYEAAVAAGDLKPSDTVQIDFHMYAADTVYKQTCDFVQQAMDEAAAGTGFEGKITVKLVQDEDYYNHMRQGLVDLAMTAWGGASYDPYGVLWDYCDMDALNEYGFKPMEETLTITVDGRPLTKTYNGWYLALCQGEYATAAYETRNTILAAVEKALLEHYNMIPFRYANSSSMISQRVVEGADHFVNDIVKRGSFQFRTYTMDDAEWEEYCRKSNYQLTY